MKYLILLQASQRDYDILTGKSDGHREAWTAAEFAALGEFMERFNRELTDSGELVDTRGLTAPAFARRVQVKDGVKVVTDGPYAETQEVLASYWVVDCASFDRATEIAAGLTECPGPGTFAEAVVDVRPIAESRHELEL
jgi:hypothetical protein